MPIEALLIAHLVAAAPEPESATPSIEASVSEPESELEPEPEPEPLAPTVVPPPADPPPEAVAVPEASDPAPIEAAARPVWDRPLPSADWLHDDARDDVLMQRSTGALMIGLGLTLGIVAPVLVMKPTPALRLQVEGELSIAAVPVPLSSGLVLGIGGGVLSFVGARSLANAYLDRSLDESDVGRRKISERRRNIRVLAGLSLGLAGSVFVAGVANGAIAGAKWSDVVGRDPSPFDAIDGQDVALRASRAVALTTALPALVGLGVGLLVSQGARGETTRLVPTGSGLALHGRF